MDKMLFFRSFFNSPKTVGSIIPSSKKLAKTMVTLGEISRDSIVVELGAGTGIITKTIFEQVDLKTPLIIFENDRTFYPRLNEFKNTILFDDAFLLSTKLEMLKERVDVFYCGLPLLNFSMEQIEGLLNQIYEVLTPGGKLVCFQYTPLLFPKLNEAFDECFVKLVYFNFPPAFVFTCVKK